MSTASFDIFSVVAGAVDNVFKQRFEDRACRADVVAALMQWLAKARKRDVPDLDERLRAMRARVEIMVESMTIEIKKDKPVVKVTGSGEETWKMFQYGTNWFEPNSDLVETVMSGLFNK